jgi:hypothetical protein
MSYFRRTRITAAVWALVTAGWWWRYAYERWPGWRTAQGIAVVLLIMLVAWAIDRRCPGPQDGDDGEGRRLLEYALHLRMNGERAPGGNETWAEFDRRCEAYLRHMQ